jgi:hypothetical protein
VNLIDPSGLQCCGQEDAIREAIDNVVRRLNNLHRCGEELCDPNETGIPAAATYCMAFGFPGRGHAYTEYYDIYHTLPSCVQACIVRHEQTHVEECEGAIFQSLDDFIKVADKRIGEIPGYRNELTCLLNQLILATGGRECGK